MNSLITFEEIVLTAIDATQDVFLTCVGVDVFAGKVTEGPVLVESEITGLVGIAGGRVGYLMVAIDRESAGIVAERLFDEKATDPEMAGDAVAELVNMIADSFRTSYHEQLGHVNVGPPLLTSGKVRSAGRASAGDEGNDSARPEGRGVVIPFRSLCDELRFDLVICC